MITSPEPKYKGYEVRSQGNRTFTPVIRNGTLECPKNTFNLFPQSDTFGCIRDTYLRVDPSVFDKNYEILETYRRPDSRVPLDNDTVV